MLETPFDVVFANGISVKSKAPRYRDTIYTAIKEAILSGQLIPNQPLVEEQLASTLNVSRTPVREALALLEHERFIAPHNGRGLYVRAVTHKEFMEMFIANEAVEPYLARRAALLATEQQLAAIEQAIQCAKKCASQLDTAGFLRASRDFHKLIGEAAGNRPLAEFVMQNEERTDMYLINYGKVVEQERMAASVNEHRAILGALQDRDPEVAERLVIYHAQSLRERFTELFSKECLVERSDGEESESSL
jgi:DNA-binding GntR family transcriptional regulator